MPSTLVYSTETGRICPGCGQPLAQCTCHSAARASVAGDGVVRVSRQTKGRGGKTVTLVKGVALDTIALATLGKQLRSACGSGGTVKDAVIEVQGDHVELVMTTLNKLGYKSRLAGA
jgi:translation initiation factor 1